MGVFEAQIAWFLSPLGIGILLGGAILIGSGLLGRIVLFVERELQIRNTSRRRANIEPSAGKRRAA